MSAPRIRAATAADVGAILAVKERLRVSLVGEEHERGEGGFLLGSTAEQYLGFVAQADVLLLEAEGAVLGFSVTLPDEVLRASELWARRERIRWSGLDPAEIEPARLGYVEQLGVLRGALGRRWAPAFAMAALLRLAEAGHEHIFATVVREPFTNLAPLPLLRQIGARAVGRVDEEYPEVGRLVSDVYHLRPATWAYDHLPPESALWPLRRRIARMVERLWAGT